MNIFVTYPCPIQSARIQHDRHVVKMILESAQMLSSACQPEELSVIQMIYNEVAKSFPDSSLYKPAYIHHPATQWATKSPANFVWLTIHMESLMQEYRRRFNRAHKCNRLLYLFAAISGRITDSGFYRKEEAPLYSTQDFGLQFTRVIKATYDFATQYHTPFVYCGPEIYCFDRDSNDGVVAAYRAYYLGEKVAGNRWTQHADLVIPDWLKVANPIIVLPKHLREPAKRQPRRVFTQPKPDLAKLAAPAAVRLGNLNFNRSN